ncbi:MAG: hypothetical protein WCT08_05035 [Patescibacteria group bacterium]|jgi:hypothetical protein
MASEPSSEIEQEPTKPNEGDKAITIVALIDASEEEGGKNYLILDKRLFAWKNGVNYLKEEKGLSESEIDSFIVGLPEETRIYKKETVGGNVSPDVWLESVLNEYKRNLEVGSEPNSEPARNRR